MRGTNQPRRARVRQARRVPLPAPWISYRDSIHVYVLDSGCFRARQTLSGGSPPGEAPLRNLIQVVPQVPQRRLSGPATVKLQRRAAQSME